MRIRRLKEEFPWTTEQTKSRSPGLHLSDIIRDMDVTLLKTKDREIDDDTRMLFEEGYRWERVLSLVLLENMPVRLGEVELDGIVGSPDGLAGDTVEEYKCTSMSMDKPPSDNWKWMMQVKGYCKMLGMRRCVFRIVHRMYVPVYKVWELTFTQAELDENWESVLNHAKVMKERGIVPMGCII